MNWKLVKDLNIRQDTEINRGKQRSNTLEIWVKKIIFYVGVQKYWNKNKNWLSKCVTLLKNSCITNETIYRTKRRSTEWDKMIVSSSFIWPRVNSECGNNLVHRYLWIVREWECVAEFCFSLLILQRLWTMIMVICPIWTWMWPSFPEAWNNVCKLSYRCVSYKELK